MPQFPEVFVHAGMAEVPGVGQPCPPSLPLQDSRQGHVLENLVVNRRVRAGGLVNAAPNQNERAAQPRRAPPRMAGVVQRLHEDGKSREQGHDHLLPERAAVDRRKHAQPVHVQVQGLGRRLPQGQRMMNHVGVDEQQPVAVRLAHSLHESPALADPCLAGRRRCAVDDPAESAVLERSFRDSQRGVGGLIVDEDDFVAWVVLRGESRQAFADDRFFVARRDDDGDERPAAARLRHFAG